MTDEYEIDGETIAEKDGSGNLVIKNIDEATIDRLAGALNVDGNNLTDSGTTVYDATSKTIGNGTTSANHQSVSTDDLLGTYPTRVRGVADGGVVASIDPSSTSTPVQDALDAVSAAGEGTVYLPPGAVTEQGPITLPSYVRIRGHGSNGGKLGANPVSSEINISNDDSADGFDFPDGIEGVNLEGFTLTGTGPTGTATVAWDLPTNGNGPANWRFNDIAINNWRGMAMSGDFGFQGSHGRLFVGNVDAGDQSAVVDITAIGPDNQIEEFVCYPFGSDTGQESLPLSVTGIGQLRIESINLGRASQRVADISGNARVSLGRVNYEPSVSFGSVFQVIKTSTAKRFHIDELVVNGEGGAVDQTHSVTIDSTDGIVSVGDVIFKNGASLNSKLWTGNDRTAVTRYGGLSGDVTNASGGTLTQPIACLGDLTTVN